MLVILSVVYHSKLEKQEAFGFTFQHMRKAATSAGLRLRFVHILVSPDLLLWGPTMRLSVKVMALLNKTTVACLTCSMSRRLGLYVFFSLNRFVFLHSINHQASLRLIN